MLAGCRIGFDPLTTLGDDDSGATNDATGAGGDGAPTTTPIDAAPGTLLPAVAADSFIHGNDTSPNGGDIETRCGRLGGNGNNLWALWRFDLSGVSGSVSNATLRLYQFASSGALTMDFEIYRVTATWDEATVDWNNATSTTAWTAGGAISSNVYSTATVTLGANGFYDWDLTALVNEWLAGGAANHGLEMQYVTQPAPGNYAIFASREHPTAAWRPQLLLTQ